MEFAEIQKNCLEYGNMACNFTPKGPHCVKSYCPKLELEATMVDKHNNGYQRQDKTGKGRPSLMPTELLRRLAIWYEGGAAKHGDRNWEKGSSVCDNLDSAQRHLWAMLEGATDEDHMAAAVWNIFAAEHNIMHHPEFDDRPVKAVPTACKSKE